MSKIYEVKQQPITVTDNFNETIEYRPIIKYSTTTAIIDVEMRLIDAVDDSYIIRRASYGMLQDEVSKYSLRLMKINLSNAAKPKIYNIKNAINPDLVGVANSMGMITVNSFKKKSRILIPSA
jgi:acetamidase/formamidase